MRQYTHSLNHYQKELKFTKQKIEILRDDLNDYLESNTGRTSTHQSNQAIMNIVDDLINLSYNEKHDEDIIYNIVHGYALEGDAQ